MCACVCAWVCVRVCVCACDIVCVCVCVSRARLYALHACMRSMQICAGKGSKFVFDMKEKKLVTFPRTSRFVFFYISLNLPPISPPPPKAANVGAPIVWRAYQMPAMPPVAMRPVHSAMLMDDDVCVSSR